ncbi:uncharacterized protein LOC110723364 [Chenopodium quinoa]|uniref:uncharacterized protein LOC110723364 n=1 Tax=Chenopodium quinoa TaxID=63459 RepID=UPI000B775D8A|nr:uncharacterized protein LOC110723364 [Chenopodium quinoa]
MLAYGLAADVVDEYVRISQSTARVALQRFCAGIIDQFRTEYLRNPTTDDLARILHQNELRGFLGMIGRIYGYGIPSLVFPDLVNYLNVLYRSRVFDEVLHGRAPPVNFTVNDHEYNMAYYLADDIYPKWATFIQGITHPQLQKDKMFADHQAAARKDVEKAFGVLQARFAIIRKLSLAYDEDILRDIMKACIFMHNMIVEDEHHNYTRAEVLRSFYEEDQQEFTPASTSTTPPFEFNDKLFCERFKFPIRSFEPYEARYWYRKLDAGMKSFCCSLMAALSTYHLNASEVTRAMKATFS